MADPSKSQPTFSWGSTSTAGSSSLFGQSSTGTPKPPSNDLFGATSNTSSTPSLFGEGSNANQGSSLFGGGGSKTNQGSNPFGGATSNTNQGSGLFGGASTGGGNAFGGTSQAGGAGFSFSTNQGDQAKPSGSGFGGANSSGGGSLFGNIGSPTSASAPFGASTPTSKPASAFSFPGGPSTTPAGPPPSNPLSFSNQNLQEQTSNAFGLGRPKSTAQDNSSAAAPSNPFGGASKPFGNLFQASQPAESKGQTSTSQAPTSIFASAPSNNSGGSNPFGNQPEAQPTASIFSNSSKANDTHSTNPSASSDAQQSKPEASKSMFSNFGAQSAAPSSSTPAGGLSMFPKTSESTDAPKPAFSFPPMASKPAEMGATSAAPSNLFGASNASTGASAAPATAPAPANSLFANLGKPSEKPKDATSTTAATKAPSLADAAPLSLGTASDKPASTFPTMPPPATKPTDPASSTSAQTNLGASTAGPAPTSQSRLKNKSMDEIITRWASDLSKYQKEFQRQAEKVAEWDRMLVENSDKIQKLYGNTLEAQRATGEVERQITQVENEQNELEHWLTQYETQVDEMWKAQGGASDSLQGPDKERQDTYELAEKLTERLDDMGKDLTSMIEEINDASSSLNKNNKPDDPLSQVVRVLNSHLTQLQQIDQGAAALQLKVAAAQKGSQGLGSSFGQNGPSSDAADGFYRSYMGRR